MRIITSPDGPDGTHELLNSALRRYLREFGKIRRDWERDKKEL
jgi:hypothetical protein